MWVSNGAVRKQQASKCGPGEGIKNQFTVSREMYSIINNNSDLTSAGFIYIPKKWTEIFTEKARNTPKFNL